MATKFTNSKNNQIEEAVQYYLENNVSGLGNHQLEARWQNNYK